MISVLLPTMLRPAMAVACVKQLLSTVQGHDVEVIVAIDACLDTRRELKRLKDRRIIIDYQPKAKGCSAAWNRALALAKGDPVVFAADDLHWEPGWLTEALKVHQRFGPKGGMVGFNDGHWDGSILATHYLMSRDFIVTVLGGVVAWDFYRHSFNDLEVNIRAKEAGRYAWADKAHVRHLHWMFGDRAQDDTDRATLPEHPASQARFDQRQAAGFPNDYPPVITR